MMHDQQENVLADFNRRIQRLEHDQLAHQKIIENLRLANESLEAKNQAFERELLHLRTVQNERAIGTNQALVAIERDMEEADARFRDIGAALSVVDAQIPLGAELASWIRSDLTGKVRQSPRETTEASLGSGRSRKQSLPGRHQPLTSTRSVHGGGCLSNSSERNVKVSLEERIRVTEETLARLTQNQETIDRSVADTQKTLTDLHTNLRPAQALARKFVDANGWTEKELSHWRTVLSADGMYGASQLSGGAAGGGDPIVHGKKAGKSVTINREVHAAPAGQSPAAVFTMGRGGDSKGRKYVRRKSSSDLLFVPPPGDTRPMSLFYCVIM